MTRIIKLNNDFKIDRNLPKFKMLPESDAVLTASYIEGAVALGYKNGLSSDQRRIFAQIKDTMDKAINNEKESFEISEVEYAFIRKAFDTAIVPSSESVLFLVVEDAVMQAEVKKDN